MPQSTVANRKLLSATTTNATTPSALTAATAASAMATPSDDDEDDYLSEKFLATAAAAAVASSSTPSATTYRDRRRQAHRESALKVEKNNRKNRSRKEIEEESRRLGLQKSLFDRAREQDDALAALTAPATSLPTSSLSAGVAAASAANKLLPAAGDSENEESSYALVKDPPPYPTKNKALNILLKMGFKEGQPLGRQHSAGLSDSPSASDDGRKSLSPPTTEVQLTSTTPRSPVVSTRAASPPAKHPPTSPKTSKALVEPLPIDVWAGRKGIGLGKRSFKPDSETVVSGRAPKLPKVDDDPRSRLDEEAFRNRAKEEYEERRASGNLANARRALVDLDEKKGVKFDILWIDPHNLSTVPKELQVRLQWVADEDGDPRFLHGLDKSINDANRSEAEKLREQMIADALRPVVQDFDDLAPPANRPRPRPPEEKKQPPKDFDIEVDDDMLEDTKIFLTLNARTRLRYTLEYLRKQHFYCFWCGTSYCSEKALEEKCPGEDETDHD